MANNDQIIGLIMAIIAAIGIIVEFILIFNPLWDTGAHPFTERAMYWAIAVPVFIGVFGVLAIVLWIGITMFQTPPPEAWDFEDLEDEFEDFEDSDEEMEEEKESS